MRRVIRILVIASVVAGVAGLAAALLRSAGSGVGEHRFAAPMRPLRGIVGRYWNPFVVRRGLVGGARSPWAFIEHVGRRSGRVYRTPILPRRTADGFEIPLPYGADAQWAQNVLAAGRARLQLHETVYALDHPEVIGAAETRALTAYERWRGTKLGYQYLRVHRGSETPGTLDHPDHEVAVTEAASIQGTVDARAAATAGPEGERPDAAPVTLAGAAAGTRPVEPAPAARPRRRARKTPGGAEEREAAHVD